MAQNLRRLKKNLSYLDPDGIANLFHASFYGYFNAQDIKWRGEQAKDILRVILREREFNDYSGNMSRSYYVRFARDGAAYTFTPQNVNDPVMDETERGNKIYYLAKLRHDVYTRARTYRAVGRHTHYGKRKRTGPRKYHFRYFRPDIEPGFGKIAYLSKVIGNKERGIRKRANPKRGYRRLSKTQWTEIQYSIEIGNDTPYAPFVQNGAENPRSGHKNPAYNVLNPATATVLKRDIEKKSFGMARVAVRNMVYDIGKRGYTAWWDSRNNPFAKK